jgi:putative ABC transport system substrate-binding protein
MKVTSRKRLAVNLCVFMVAFFGLVVSPDAQQVQPIPRVGFISGSGDAVNPPPSEKAFREGLKDLGYLEGKNIVLEIRYAEGDRNRLPTLVAELVNTRVDVIVTANLTAIRAAKPMTQTIPIVMVTNADPVATKIINSLAQPGGNITGLTNLSRELSAKRLELLKEIVPNLSQVAILWDDSNEGSAIGYKEYEAAARSLKLKLYSVAVRGPEPAIEAAFVTAKKQSNGLIPIGSAILLRDSVRIATLATSNRLPSVYDGSNYVDAGGLASYSSKETDLFRRATVYVDRILKGAKPADLPVEQPTKFELLINLKTAKQIGLIIPPNVLARADRVIR